VLSIRYQIKEKCDPIEDNIAIEYDHTIKATLLLEIKPVNSVAQDEKAEELFYSLNILK